ncbi:hypothetical protein A3J32_01870 [Candidatus Saccharibacteria bacterium RIFCSPLOWO2_02_FULL_46_7]|nr:MAG: hypothetical protein A3J32_01870 [Candidatus Saccharibacteria bacterium RIFCSPLOWO2_02_FULL_46_7]
MEDLTTTEDIRITRLVGIEVLFASHVFANISKGLLLRVEDAPDKELRQEQAKRAKELKWELRQKYETGESADLSGDDFELFETALKDEAEQTYDDEHSVFPEAREIYIALGKRMLSKLAEL